MASLFTQLTLVKRLTADLDLGSSAGALQNVTDLAIPVINGIDCHFTFILRYTAGSAIGMRCGINCDGTGTLRIGEVAANATTGANYGSITALNTVIFAATAGVTTAEVAIISGVFSPTQNGTLTFQACNEGSGAMVLNQGSAVIYSTNFLLSDSVSVSESITIAITPLLPAVSDAVLSTDTIAQETFDFPDAAAALTGNYGWTKMAGTPGADWGIVSQQAKISGNASSGSDFRLDVAFDSAQLASIDMTIQSLSGGDATHFAQIGLYFCDGTTANGYGLYAVQPTGFPGSSANLTLGKTVATVFTQLDLTNTTFAVGDNIKLTWNKATGDLKYYKNNVLINTINDTALTTLNRAALNGYTNNAAFSAIIDPYNLAIVDAVAVAIVSGGLAVSVNDAVTLAESATVYFLLRPNVNDATTVSELFPLYLLLQITVNDLATLAEALPLDLLLQPIINDGVTTSELVTPLLPVLLTTVNDLITLAEAIVPDVLVLPVVFDGVSVSDSATVVLIAVLTLFDTVALADSGTVYFLLAIADFDTVTIAESQTINFVETLPALAFDTVALDELTAIDYFSSILNSAAADSILLDDVPTLNLTQPPLELFAFDDLAAVGGGLDGLTTID